MEFEYHNRKPQENVPVDLIIHYIVKDYQRMFLNFNEMEKRALKAEATINELKEKHLKDLEGKKREIKELKMKLSTENVEHLKAKLEIVRQQNMILANAIVALNNGDGTLKKFSGLGVPIDAKDLEKKVDTQLREALNKLTAVEERLSNFQQLMENCEEINEDSIEINFFLADIDRAFAQIESATQHIENFYKLANGMPLT